MDDNDDIYGSPDDVQLPIEQINISSILLPKKSGKIIKNLIVAQQDLSFPLYCDKVGIRSPNFYSTVNGVRPCSLDSLNKILSGIGYQITPITNLVIQKIDAGETVQDANFTSPEDGLLYEDEEVQGDDGFCY